MQTSLGKIVLIFILTTFTLQAYHFTMSVDNAQPMVGEKFILTLNFSYQNLEEYEVEEPQFEAFEVKLLEDNEFKDGNGTWQVKQRYQLIPNRAGTLTLAPLKTHIEMIEEQYQELYNRNKYLKKFDIFTKPIVINVQALPQDVTVTGEYELSANIDKNVTKLGEPIHFTVSIKGEGNLPNLDFLTLSIPHTTVYEKMNRPYIKSFDILSDGNFMIPPILLKYYNQKTKQVVLLSTQPFEIEVRGGNAKKEKSSRLWWLLILLLPLLRFLAQFFKDNEKKTLRKRLKRCKNREELLKKLMPYLHKNRQLTRLIYQLEEVETQEFKKLKKEILNTF